MKAPDKIYIPITDYELPTTNDWSGLPLSQYEWKPVLENIAYIRKDALLEWAKRMLVCFKPGFDCHEILKEVVKHIESL